MILVCDFSFVIRCIWVVIELIISADLLQKMCHYSLLSCSPILFWLILVQ